MWTPGLVYPMFCNSVAPLVFPQDPQETGETRDDQPHSIKAEGSSAGATGAAGRCGGCSPHVLLCRLQRPLRTVLRVLRVLRVLHVVPPRCLWRRDVTLYAFCRSFPRRPKARRPNKGPRRPQKALQKALPRVRTSQQGAMVVRQVSRCALIVNCGVTAVCASCPYGSVVPLESALACVARSARVARYMCLDSCPPVEDSTPFSVFCRRLCE